MSEIDAGEELDRLVQGEVFGDKMETSMCTRCAVSHLRIYEPDYPEPYSTDLVTAWKVVEKLRGDGFGIYIQSDDEGWAVEASRTTDRNSIVIDKLAATLPVAICRAAVDAATRAAKEGGDEN